MGKEIIPVNISPREKLELYGEASLSVQELLAIILNVGTKDNDVMEISKKLMEFGGYGNSLRFLQEISISELQRINGIGRIKAIELKAVGEIAKRINSPVLKSMKITTNYDVFCLLENELKYEKREIVKLLILNTKNEILKIMTITIRKL